MSAESAEYEVPVEGDRTSVPDAVPMDDSEADTDVFNSTSGQFSFTLFLAILILIGGCAVYLTIKKQKEEDKKFAFFAEMVRLLCVAVPASLPSLPSCPVLPFPYPALPCFASPSLTHPKHSTNPTQHPTQPHTGSSRAFSDNSNSMSLSHSHGKSRKHFRPKVKRAAQESF